MIKCEFCLRQHSGNYGSGRFCGSKCARTFSSVKNKDFKNKKISLGLKKYHEENPSLSPELHRRTCVCGKDFFVSDWQIKFKAAKYCGVKCGRSLGGKRGGRISVKKQVRRSKNEILFGDLCEKEFKNVVFNKCIFNGWDADIIIHDFKIAILWNGKWHYEKITKKHSLSQTQNRDNIKEKEIIKCGYLPYIIKDLGKFNKGFVKKQFEDFKELLLPPTPGKV